MRKSHSREGLKPVFATRCRTETRTRPLNDRDLARIEKVTGLSLPTAYENLLREFPAELLALLKFDEPDDRMLFTDTFITKTDCEHSRYRFGCDP